MADLRELLLAAAERAAAFRASLDERRVFPSVTADDLRAALGGPLPEGPTDPARVLAELADAAEPGIVASAGGRYFGFVIGGSVDASVAADVLAAGWDQNAGLYVTSPASS